MEQHAFKDATLAIARAVLGEEEFRDAPRVMIAMQAYLRETERDLEALLDWARRSRRRVGVRLVKGAYWDSEIAWAAQKGWLPPVFTEKPETDLAYERLSRRLLESHDIADAAFGSHNLRSIAHVIACARTLGLPAGAYEIQMLHGMAEPMRHALVERGERVRVYLPVGDLIPGMAYLIRRLLENTSNVSFLRETYADEQDLDRLTRPPVVPSVPRAVRQDPTHISPTSRLVTSLGRRRGSIRTRARRCACLERRGNMRFASRVNGCLAANRSNRGIRRIPTR